MATGVKPRDEESALTRSDLDAIQEAMKHKKFRDLLADYCEEVRDPANQALYQKEMTQLEKERGFDVTFLNTKGSYVIKTSVAGDRKAFINICSNENIGKPSYTVQEIDGQRGMNWQLPYSIVPPREDFNHKKERCIIYDVIFHPDALRMAEVNKRFRDLVNKTAYEGLQNTYKIHFDSNNFKFPKSHYKGMNVPSVIRKEDPTFKPAVRDDNTTELSSDLLDKLYPQHCYDTEPKQNENIKPKKTKTMKPEFSHACLDGYTVPKYTIKQQKNVELENYTYHKYCKQNVTIPSQLVVEINLPLLSSTKDCVLDVHDKSLCLISEKPARYKLNINLPYSVNSECGNAKFDKTKRMLIISLSVIGPHLNNNNLNSTKVDSGVESEENTGSHSDEDNVFSKVVELTSTETQNPTKSKVSEDNFSEPPFLESSLAYILPSYTHNVLDDAVAFTFHVKNTEPDSVMVKKDNNKVYIKFTTVGSGFVPLHYAALIKFEENILFDNAIGEAWDNNVILQLELHGEAPQKFEIGLSEDNMTCEEFDMSLVTKSSKLVSSDENIIKNLVIAPVVQVTNLGTETNIVVSSNQVDDEDNDDNDEMDDLDSPTQTEKEIIWIDSGNNVSRAKSILRKPRSYSESSAGDIASSMDYISSDYIPEESSLKKTVRFNGVIAKQFYRYNSSIEGQKKKNQRRKSKKQNQNRKRSESEAEDEITTQEKPTKPRVKTALKQRRDSGLADTSDAETECKTESYGSENEDVQRNNDSMSDNNSVKSILNIVDSKPKEKDLLQPKDSIRKPNPETKKSEPLTCDNIKHNTDLYNPDKLNKGQYLEVSFKNDLIFDLDM